MPRPTFEFKTEGGHVIVFNQYITGAEHRDIRAVYIRGLSTPEKERDAAAIDFEADNVAFRAAIVSVDGVAEKVDQLVLALPLADFKEVVAQVSDITEAKKK